MKPNAGLTTSNRSVVPAPSALAAFAVLGLMTVALLPAVGARLPWETEPEPNVSQVALTALGVVLLTAAYVMVAAQTSAWARTPAVLTFAYLAGIAMAKFILSPASFRNAPDTDLSEYLWLGLAVMVLYLGGLTFLYWFAGRYRQRQWPWLSKVGAVLAVLAFAVVSRSFAALVLGRDVGDYLRDVFRGGGVWLLLLLAGSTVAAIEAFGHSERALAFRAGLAVIVVYHALWVPYMIRLFD